MSKEEGNQYNVLIKRMEKLIIHLDIRQGELRIPVDVDLYWYIQKLKEVELLVEGVTIRQRDDLRRPLDDLCASILFKLKKDEERFDHRRSA